MLLLAVGLAAFSCVFKNFSMLVSRATIISETIRSYDTIHQLSSNKLSRVSAGTMATFYGIKMPTRHDPLLAAFAQPACWSMPDGS